MKKNYSMAIFFAMLLFDSGSSGAEGRALLDASTKIGCVTGKSLIARIDKNSSPPLSVGIGGAALSGSTGFGAAGLSIDRSRLLDQPVRSVIVYEYELTMFDNEKLKIKSDVDIREGDCAKAFVSDRPNASAIEPSLDC